MAGEWRSVAVSDVVSAVSGGTPRRNVKEYWNGDIPWATAKDVASAPGKGLNQVQEFITKEGLESSSAKLMPAGTVVITARGTVGALAQLRCEMAFNQTCYALIPGDDLDNSFLYYALTGTVAEMQALTYGTVFDTITKRTFDNWLIRLPPLAEQRAIAHILGTLDDKIELNRRMNETLEEMARALFKSWFVDFDPVRAKREGRWRRGESRPGMPAELYDIFPDRLAPSELGEIPAGWGVRTVGEVAKESRESVQPQAIESGTPYIALEHMPKRRLALSEWGIADKVSSNKFRFKQGDILFGKLRPYFHKVGIAPLEGVCSTDIVVVSPASDGWFGFVLGHLSSNAFVDYTDATSTGTRMPRTKWRDMARYKIALPDRALAEAFTIRIQPWVKRIVSAIHESRSLAALRDTLLPKLICGELRVPDTAQLAEDAV